MNGILSINLAQLAGYVGSNPQLVSTFPDNLVGINKDEIIKNSLPHGVEPGQVLNTKINGKNFISYTFKMERKGDRDDLVALSVIVDEKDVNVEDFITVFLYICENLLKRRFTTQVLMENLNKIFESCNTLNKMIIDGYEIDPREIIQAKKLNLGPKKAQITKKNVKGRFF